MPLDEAARRLQRFLAQRYEADTAPFAARIATLTADLGRVTRERDEARYDRDSSDGAFRLAVIRADTAEREATATRADLAEAKRLLEHVARLVKANRWREDYSAYLARRKAKETPEGT